MVKIYTDGACSGNPGPGGLGVVMLYNQHRKEISEGYRLTTNNRMELLAVIRGLQALKKPGIQVMVTSDSNYVVKAVEEGWVFNWEKKNFAKKKNPDLWKIFLELYRQHQVSLKWIKGHSNHPLNERCDELAVMAYQQSNLMADTGFEQLQNQPDLFNPS